MLLLGSQSLMKRSICFCVVSLLCKVESKICFSAGQVKACWQKVEEESEIPSSFIFGGLYRKIGNSMFEPAQRTHID
uniref:Putative ovule protein n=1 Tax=Solanum chacoense TaxID=4108 RepID=A0A0V0HL59_SOLCH